MNNSERKAGLIREEARELRGRAENAVYWCDERHQTAERYWAGAYRGERIHRLIVQQGVIVGSVPDGFHGSKPVGVDFGAWQMALMDVIRSKVGHSFSLVRAVGRDGSFFLQSSLYLPYFRNVMIRRVPDGNGGENVTYEIK